MIKKFKSVTSHALVKLSHLLGPPPPSSVNVLYGRLHYASCFTSRPILDAPARQI